MVRTLDRTKDIFLDTMLLGNEILIKKIKVIQDNIKLM